MIDLIMTIVREFSHFAFDLGLVLPCWDIVADSFGVCR
jgi:hypothetical protein